MQKNEKKYTKAENAITIITAIFIISFMVFYFTLIIIYGGKPLEEIPEWIRNTIFRR